jgi:hypothetical protein
MGMEHMKKAHACAFSLQDYLSVVLRALPNLSRPSISPHSSRITLEMAERGPQGYQTAFFNHGPS